MKRGSFLFLALFIAACANPPPPQENHHSIRYLALGDSYTSGENVDESARWPVQLTRALRADGFDVGDPLIIAQTGWTTGNLAQAIGQENPQPSYRLVTLLIGVNNQYQGRSEEEYRQEFVTLLHRARDLAGGNDHHVIVLSIPDWGVTPYAARLGADPSVIAAAIDRFNAINRAETAKVGAAYVDVTKISRARRDLVADDGLHPSEAMYQQWMKLTLPAAETALRN